MDWKTVCADPNLKNLPYKIELNAKGQIIMSPAKLYHRRFQHKIGMLLAQHLGHGEVIMEAAIQTSDSTKVADVAWFSESRWQAVKAEFEASLAPEICVEIQSQSNTHEELADKHRVYLEAGVQEFWICNEGGHLRFWDHTGALEGSRLAPAFPTQIDQ